MSWIYLPKNFPYTAATEGSPSRLDSPTSQPVQSATSNGTNTANKSSKPESQTATSMMPQSGMTSSPLTVNRGVDQWILLLRDSPASLTAWPVKKLAKGMNETSGPIHSESLGRWHPDSSSWRTSQASLWEVMDGHHMGGQWSESWPTQGMTRSGELYPLPTQAHHISATGGGSLPVRWNTPNTMDALSAKSQQALDHEHETARPGRSNPNNLRDQVAVSAGQTLWPTPDSSPRGARASDLVADNGRSVSRRTSGQQRGIDLPTSVKMFSTPVADTARMLPTPRTRGLLGGSGSREMVQAMVLDGTLSEEEGVALLGVKMWATPRVDDSKNNGSPSQQARHGPALNVPGKLLPTPRNSPAMASGTMGQIIRTMDTTGYTHKLEEAVAGGEEDSAAMSDGSLSPDWVSWLMGLPVGWTSLDPLPREEYDDWFHSQMDGTWWLEERGLPRVAVGIQDRVNRLKCLGNGIVPASGALAIYELALR